MSEKGIGRGAKGVGPTQAARRVWLGFTHLSTERQEAVLLAMSLLHCRRRKRRLVKLAIREEGRPADVVLIVARGDEAERLREANP